MLSIFAHFINAWVYHSLRYASFHERCRRIAKISTRTHSHQSYINCWMTVIAILIQQQMEFNLQITTTWSFPLQTAVGKKEQWEKYESMLPSKIYRLYMPFDYIRANTNRKKMNMIKHSKWQNETRTINPLSHSISAIIHQQKFYCMQIIVIFDLCAHESLHFARGFIFVESSLRLG